MAPDDTRTMPLADGEPAPLEVRRFHLTVVEGASAGRNWESSADRCSIGSHPSNDLVLEDPSVSRFHCELHIDARGVRVRDLGSRNGTVVDGIRVIEAFLRPRSVLKLGRCAITFQLRADRVALPLSSRSELGALVGTSVAMRTAFALLERAAASDATVLIEGETGTGKEGAAEAIHLGSARAPGPFVVVDCGAIPPALLENELFGHEKGAFTGASERRPGAFEEAAGGTIFLDEVGELPADLQPKLLRALERKEIRPLGGGQLRAVDVRIVAATNRDLRTLVNDGRFRSDLYFRLAVVKISMPPLNARLEDIPILVDRLLARLAPRPDVRDKLRSPALLADLQRASWPGNVRELRNYLERCVVFEQALPTSEAPAAAPSADLSYAEARRLALDEFERRFLDKLLARHQGHVTQAAEAAGMDRVHLHRLMRRHGRQRQGFKG
jgi:DNA-binding NtrC family response regulator